MLAKHQHKFNWNRAVSSLTIALGTFLTMSLSANAVPEISLQIAQVRSRVIPPTPLNVTPLPGRHISLPRGRSRARDDYSGYDLGRPYRSRSSRYHRHGRRSRGDTTIIIINPNHDGKYYNNRRGERVRVIRP